MRQNNGFCRIGKCMMLRVICTCHVACTWNVRFDTFGRAKIAYMLISVMSFVYRKIDYVYFKPKPELMVYPLLWYIQRFPMVALQKGLICHRSPSPVPSFHSVLVAATPTRLVDAIGGTLGAQRIGSACPRTSGLLPFSYCYQCPLGL